MSNLNNRIAKLETQQQPEPMQQITDEARTDRIRELSVAIADEANAQGITAQDDPRLSLPLVIAEVLRNEQP